MYPPRSSAASASAREELKERKPCVYCHVGAWDSQKYTEAGQYYKDHEHSFKGYVPKSDPAKAPADSKKKSDGRH